MKGEHLIMISYVEHPTFDFDISVDIYANNEFILPMTIMNVERLTIASERAAKIHGYVDVNVPVDACSARLTKSIINLSEVVREAQNHNITSIKARCAFTVMLDARDYQMVERKFTIDQHRYFDVSVVGYMIDDCQYVNASQTVFDDEICSFATYYITELRNESYANRAYLEIKRKVTH